MGYQLKLVLDTSASTDIKMCRRRMMEDLRLTKENQEKWVEAVLWGKLPSIGKELIHLRISDGRIPLGGSTCCN